MRALSIQQPWAYCITHGTKRVENRTWYTPFRGRIALHAGKTYQKGVEYAIHDDSPEVDIPGMQSAPRGAIVGFATLIDCVRASDVDEDQRIWAGGPWCFVLSDVTACFPIPQKGMLGFFEVAVEEADLQRTRS